jgi:hypothetical protein
MTLIITSCIIWIACGVLAYGAALAEFSAGMPDDHKLNRACAVAAGLLGPMGLLLQTLGGGFKHGFMWRRR